MISKKAGLFLIFALTVFMLAGPDRVSFAATNLKLNPSLDYTSDSNDGPLITGDGLSDGSLRDGTPAYVIFYHRECYNSKRQARRTVELYGKYMGKVDFIIVDLDTELSKEQQELRERYYRGYIPHVTVMNGKGEAVYDKSGEVGTDKISLILDGLL
jgi:hypothetical protein